MARAVQAEVHQDSSPAASAAERQKRAPWAAAEAAAL